MLSVQGKSVTGSAVLKVDFDAALLAVDDLLRPEPTEAYIAPGFIDLQVNGLQELITMIPRHRTMPLGSRFKRCSPLA